MLESIRFYIRFPIRGNDLHKTHLGTHCVRNVIVSMLFKGKNIQIY